MEVMTLSETDEMKEVTFDSTYGELPKPNRIGHNFTGWLDNETSTVITEDTVVNTADNQILYAQWEANNYTVTLDFDNGTVVEKIFKYDEEIDYPGDPTKTFHKFKGWCARRENRVECGIERVPDRDIKFFQSFEVDAGLATGTAVGALVRASLLIFILIVVIIVIKILIRWMRLSHTALDIEMAWIKKSNEEEETRIVRQIEATTVAAKVLKRSSKTF